MTKTSATTAPATVTVVNPLDPEGFIAAHKAAVPAGIDNRTRALREAALDGAALYGPFTVEGEYTTTDGVKFSAWVTGARGHNGYIVTTKNGTRYVTGLTTVLDLITRNAVTNPESVTGKANAPTVKGILL